MIHPEGPRYSRRRLRRIQARKNSATGEIKPAGIVIERTETPKRELQKVTRPLTEIATELRARHDDHLRDPGGINKVDPFTPSQIASGLGHIADALQRQIAQQYDANPFTLEKAADALDSIAGTLETDAAIHALTMVKGGESKHEEIIRIKDADERVIAAIGKIRDENEKTTPIFLNGVHIGYMIPTLTEGLYVGVFGIGELVVFFAARPEDMQKSVIHWTPKPPTILPEPNALGK